MQTPALTLAQSGTPRRGLSRELGSILLLNGALALWLLFHQKTGALHKAVDNFLQLLGPLGMAIWASRRVWKTALPRRSQLGLQLLLLGGGGFGLGTLIWGTQEALLKTTPPFPSVADAIWIPSLLAVLPGVFLIAGERSSAVARIRVILDSLTTLSALITFSWYYILGPTLLNSKESLQTRLASAFYPAFDLLLIFSVLLLALLQGRARLQLPTLKLAWSFVIVIVADTSFSYQSLLGTYETGGILDLGWPLGWMLVALSIDRLRESMGGTEAPQASQNKRQPFWRFLIPYLLLPAIGMLVISAARNPGDEKLEPGIFFCSLVTILLVVLRQVIALLENRQLYEKVLESKLALEKEHAVSQQLQESNAQLVATQTELLNNNLALAEANVRLAALATTDGMTGLANHRTFQEQLRLELGQTTAAHQPCALLLIDVDHFKSFNDTFGHPAGDLVLCTVSALLRQALSPSHLAARYGGEEFAVLLPGLDATAASALAEDVRARIADHAFPQRRITVSIGIAVSPDDALSPEDLILAADQALYHSKSSGRNQATLARDVCSLRTLFAA